MQNKFCVRLRLAVAVILNKSLTRRQANITALAISLADRQISQIRLRIYLVAESLVGTRLSVLFFDFIKSPLILLNQL